MFDHVAKLLQRYPVLKGTVDNICLSVEAMCKVIRNDGTMFFAGNGGSGADSEHICGELLKGFLKKRSLDDFDKAKFQLITPDGPIIAQQLQNGFRAISLLSHSALTSAFGNDVNPLLGFAQQLWVLGRSGDLVMGISTSGNAKNISYLFQVAKSKNITTVLLTGSGHGSCEKLADIVINVPENETFMIQELHLPIYHAICAAIEEEFFSC